MTEPLTWPECLELAERNRAPRIINDFRALQRAWDAENAQAELPGPRPSAALVIGGGLLLVLVGVIGAAAMVIA